MSSGESGMETSARKNQWDHFLEGEMRTDDERSDTGDSEIAMNMFKKS